MQNAVPITVAQLTYQSLYQAVLTWMIGVNPRAVSIRYGLVAAFIAGLLWFRGKATCTIIGQGGAFSHDALNRLLVGGPLRSFLQVLALSLVDKSKGYLVLDDIVIAKTGPDIQGVKILFSPSEERMVLGLNVVVLGWRSGECFIPLTFRFWKRPVEKGSKVAFDGTPFKNKIDLAIEMLHWANLRGFQPTAVLFDCFYLTKKLVGWLKVRDWQWVSRIKEGRRLIRNGRKFSPKLWIKLAPIKRAPTLKTSVEAELPGWGSVRVIRANSIPGAKRRFLVGSNPNWGRGTIERLYGYRWKIEVAFRDASQMLGLRDCQCRSFQAQENHFALAMMAYLFLQSQKMRSESAGETMRRLTVLTISHAGVGRRPKVRPIKPEKRRRRQSAHVNTLSAMSA